MFCELAPPSGTPPPPPSWLLEMAGFGGFDGFGSSGEHLVLLLLLQHKRQRGNRDGFLTVLAVSAVSFATASVILKFQDFVADSDGHPSWTYPSCSDTLRNRLPEFS